MLEGLARFVDRRRWRVYYLAVGATLLFGVALPKAFSAWDGIEDRFGTVVGGDFLAFYTGGRMVLEGQSRELYDLDAQKELQDELRGRVSNGSTAFVNPPPYALAMVPFGALPYVGAVLAWWVVALLILIAALRAVRSAIDRDAFGMGGGLTFSLLLLPSTLALIMGQNTFVSLGLATAAFLALRKEREGLAGIALGAMILKPQLAFGFAVVLLMQRRWRAIAVATVVGLAGCALSYVLMPGAWEGYLETLPRTAALVRNLVPGDEFPAYYQVSVPSALALLVDGFAPKVGSVLGPLTTLAIGVGIGRWWRREEWAPGTYRWDLAMAASIAAGWLASPHFLFYDVALFLLPGWVAYLRLGSDPEGRPFGGGRFYGLTLLTLLIGSLWIPLFSVWLWETLKEAQLPRAVPQLITVVLVWWTIALHRAAGEVDSREKAVGDVGDLTANDPGLRRSDAE